MDMHALARASLRKAKDLLTRGDEESIRYACLELRLCIEYLLLNRFQKYRDLIDEDAMSKWTPRQIITELLDADPMADTPVTIAVGPETIPGVPSSDMKVLGEDRRLKMKWANTNWQALGSFLHAPTLHQLENEKLASVTAMAEKAGEIAKHLEHVLAARVLNFTLTETITMTCGECGKVMTRPFHSVTEERGFICRNTLCGAIYNMRKIGKDYQFQLRQAEIRCPSCNAEFKVKMHQVVEGGRINCPQCYANYEVRQGYTVTKIE